jgi:4-diphosphocytidyl-2-C-methyl-D-erythritol kinase
VTAIHERAPAKLNLALEIVGRRPDGYHDLVTLFQTIDLSDEIVFEEHDELVLECDEPCLAGPSNLMLRAARALREAAGIERGARIRLTKRIPVAAGLGGGSSDAAATLRGLCRLWRIRLADATLVTLASSLGADVPFLLRGGTVLAEGRGDQLDALPDLAPHWAVLHTPEPGPPDKTARAFRALDRANWSDGDLTRSLASSLREGAPADLAGATNTFEFVADRLFDTLAPARRRFLAAGAPWIRLSGAGPTLFTLVATEREAEAIAGRIEPAAPTWRVPTVTRLC